MQAKFTKADGTIVELSGSPEEMQILLLDDKSKPLEQSLSEPVPEEEPPTEIPGFHEIRRSQRELRILKIQGILKDAGDKWLTKEKIWRKMYRTKPFAAKDALQVKTDIDILIERGEKIVAKKGETGQGKPTLYKYE